MPMSDANYKLFRDCFQAALIERISPKGSDKARKSSTRAKRRTTKPEGAHVETTKDLREDEEQDSSDAEELAEFSEYLASEIFAVIPEDLRSLSYTKIQEDPALLRQYGPAKSSEVFELVLPLVPPSVTDSISAYGILRADTSFANALKSAVEAYISAATASPPSWASTRTDACEICDRDWMFLSYHHLIPRETHEKVLKRGWHPEWKLNSVAWLCRACHSFVHRIASNEELARSFYTADLLLEREDVQSWARWVGRIRWKAR